MLYILNPRHKEGWAKGQFLIAHGFDAADVDAVRLAFLTHARSNELSEMESTAFGEKYRVDGPLNAPAGPIQVRTVWQVDTGQTAPRFVTMVPLPRRS